MKNLIFFVGVVSFLFSCNLLKEKTAPAVFDAQFNGFYSVVSTGDKFYFYEDTVDFVFIDSNVVISADDIKLMKKQKNKVMKTPELYIELTDEGAIKFADYTANYIGEKLAIIFGDRLLSAPVIQSEISGGKLVITTSDGEFIDDIISSFKQYKRNQ